MLLRSLPGPRKRVGERVHTYAHARTKNISRPNRRASVASETLTGVTQLKIGDVCWRASVASETVLGVDNAKSGICYMYICMVRMPFKRARGELFFPKNTAF